MTAPSDSADFSMDELFRLEVETQCTVLTDALVALEAHPSSSELLTQLMRAAHSLKGAARIIGNEGIVKVSHAMEDVFISAQKGEAAPDADLIDRMLEGVDLIRELADAAPVDPTRVAAFLAKCIDPAGSQSEAGEASRTSTAPVIVQNPPGDVAASQSQAEANERQSQAVRLDAASLNRVLGLAGENLVATRQFEALTARLARLGARLRRATASLPAQGMAEHDFAAALSSTQDQLVELGRRLNSLHDVFDHSSRQWTQRADRLYQEAIDSRMRPIAEILPGLRRLVRDLSHELGKPVEFQVVGEETPVDREILDRLENPLAHLLRNSLDHGIESADIRAAKGKALKGIIRLEARHLAGQLVVSLSDDGGGVDLGKVRDRIVNRGFASREAADSMTATEIIDFLFLPGFSLRDAVTEVSGRGVGLDIVQSMARGLRGSVRATADEERGLAFELRLPISLAVLRSLLVKIDGEPYAFSLAHLVRAIKIPLVQVESSEGRQFIRWEDDRVAIADARQLLGLGGAATKRDELSILLVERNGTTYGVIVDAFQGEQELVVQPLDPALGVVPAVSAASLTSEGHPVLLIDIDEIIVAMERIGSEGRIRAIRAETGSDQKDRRRILVVEDSLTVRELERKLLVDKGYAVETAVDGMDGWNTLRNGRFDLIVTDVDMPRMDGIELTKLIKGDAAYRDLPVLIVSYKDREEDRQRGLDAGADYYLTKGSFQDRALIDAVVDLIGEAR